MASYLTKTYNWQTNEIASAYDDSPVWSAMPGNLLLENIDFAPNKTIVDIGFGTGFPLLVLAERFGSTCKLIGVDVWEEAMHRAAQKIKSRGIENTELINCSAEAIGLPDNLADIITSNLGINNFEHPEKVVAECYRLLKTGGCLYLTSNLTGTFDEFYNVFDEVLKEEGESEIQKQLQKLVNARATEGKIVQLFTAQSFTTEKIIHQNYTMRYANGSAFLNDYFIVMAFLPSWKCIVPVEKQEKIFRKLEEKLNLIAEKQNGLTLSIPFVLMKFVK